MREKYDIIYNTKKLVLLIYGSSDAVTTTWETVAESCSGSDDGIGTGTGRLSGAL